MTATNDKPNRHRAHRSGAVRVLTVLAAVGLHASVALAQTAQLDSSVLTARSIGAAQTQSVEAYIAAVVADLDPTNPDAFDRAADRLAEPLIRPISAPARRSVAFRLLYERLLSSKLDEMLGSSDHREVMLALRVSGQLATDATARRITPKLRSPEAGVRLFASAQARGAFAILADGEATMSEEVALGLVDAISVAITAETEPSALDTHARALIQATGILGEDVDRVGPHAAQRLAEAIGTRTRAIPTSTTSPDALVPTLRALTALRDLLIDNQFPITTPAATASVGLAADAMAFVLARRVDGVPALGPERPAAAQGPIGANDPVELQLLSLAEVVDAYGRDRVARLANQPVPQPSQTSMSDLLRRAMLASSDRDRRLALQDLQTRLGEMFRRLGDPPYGFNTDQRFFQRR